MHVRPAMTQSSTPQTSDLPRQRLTKRPSPGRSFLTFIFRLLLLGVSGSLAALLGIVIAQFSPGRIQEPPLVEKFMQGSQALWQGVTRLPETWNDPAPESTSPPSPVGTATPSPQTDVQTDVQTDASPQLPPLPAPLSDADRQRLQAELTQLQTELQQSTDRSAALATIQQRLQAIQQQLNPDATASSPPATPAPDQSFIAPSTRTIANGELLKVTLPSDALFNADQISLRPTTSAILDSIVSDLQRYPAATIRIAGHTDNQGTADADRDRSFQQASVILQYLSGKLDDSYRWVAVGYGNTDPLVDNTSPINRQRNRRVEIVIDPRG